MYAMPFRTGARIVELGGGDRPEFRPNVDVRQGPSTDVVADLGGSLPIGNATFDGVFSKFAIEHVSWRRLHVFVQEAYRILRPGGAAVIVAPNLLEQARRLVAVGDAGEWEDRWVCMVFGDQDYPENTHRAGLSPEYAGRLFRAAGFARVIVVPFGELKTDMIIEAWKE